MTKHLRLILNGICVIAPGPRDTATPAQVSLVMPAAPRQRTAGNGEGFIRAHFAYIHFPHDAAVDKSRHADFRIHHRHKRHCDVAVLHREHVQLEPPPTNPITYCVTQTFDAAAPTEDSFGDSRWLGDLRDIVDPQGGRLKPSCLPSNGQPVDPNVSVVWTLSGGTFSTAFVCPFFDDQTFTNTNLASRVYASEVHIDLEYDDTVETVTFRTTPLDEGAFNSPDVVLRLGDERLDVRIGNDTKEEIDTLCDKNRCSPPRNVPEQAVDNDFELYYGVIESNVPQQARPLPRRGHETRHNGCIPVTTGG